MLAAWLILLGSQSFACYIPCQRAKFGRIRHPFAVWVPMQDHWPSDGGTCALHPPSPVK